MRRWAHALLRRALGIHSPSLHMLGTCWCQRGKTPEPISREEVWAMIAESARRFDWPCDDPIHEERGNVPAIQDGDHR